MDLKNYPNIEKFLKGSASSKQQRRKKILIVLLAVIVLLNIIIMVIYPPTTQEEREGRIMLMLFFLSMLIIVPLALFLGSSRRNNKITKWTEYELADIEQECSESGDTWISIGKTAVVGPLSIIPTKDIVWAYWGTITASFVLTSIQIVFVTRDRKSHTIHLGGRVGGFRKPTEEESREIFERLLKHRPHVLIGFSKENRKLWRKKNFAKMVAIADGVTKGE